MQYRKVTEFQESCTVSICPNQAKIVFKRNAAQQSVHWTGGIRRHASRKHFSGFEFILLPSTVHARPPASNANRWAAQQHSIECSMDKN